MRTKKFLISPLIITSDAMQMVAVTFANSVENYLKWKNGKNCKRGKFFFSLTTNFLQWT